MTGLFHRSAGMLAACLLSAFVACPASAKTGTGWTGAWGYAASADKPVKDPATPPGTFRYRIRLSHGGDGVALTLSNAEGSDPLGIGKVTIGVADAPSGLAVRPGTISTVTFSSTTSVALDPGRAAISDAIALAVRVGEDLIVSVSTTTPGHPLSTDFGMPMGFAASRDATNDAKGSAFTQIKVRPYLSLVSVHGPKAPCTIVTFGDSITDGALSHSPETRGWPGRLAERMAALPPTRRCSVVNMGINGNRVLRDGQATAALDRFWRDVAVVPGVTHVIFLEGINDIGDGGSNGEPRLTPDALIAGYRQIIARAHALGLKIVGGTLTPALHAAYMSPQKDRTRVAMNAFIRSGGAFDGVIDFEAVVRDPANQANIKPSFDPGDHLHPNDAGYRAMGDAIDLTLFAPRTR